MRLRIAGLWALNRLFSVALLLACLSSQSFAAGLEEEFVHPPASARPWTYWWWLNGAASKEGITRDFEEMRKQGIGGALLFDAGEAGPEVPHGPKFMSTEWRELYKHAVREADRCGIVLTVNLCSGWDCGGPWVTQEHAAKQVVSSQTMVIGPGRVNVALPRPQAVQGFYRDIAVLAAPVAATSGYKLTASSSQPDYPPVLAEDGDDATRWISHGTKPGMEPTPGKPEFLQFDCNEPRAAAGVWIKPYSDCGPKDIEVQCSDDGRTFRPLNRVTLQLREERIIAFTETPAKYFRVVFLSAYPFQDGNWNVQVSEIALLTKEQVAAKQRPLPFRWNHETVVDLTKYVNDQGRLNWDAPAGSWRILRIGYTLHGVNTVVTGSGPAGPEIDPMSAAAMDAHFAETGAKLIADAGPLAGKTLQYFHIDSWEIRQPNWTPKMREEFHRRRGYDLLPWLPALVGQKLDDVAQTGRFLQDYRRTVADLVAENYYERMAELSVKGGLLGTHSESGGPVNHWIDALQCEGKNAIPMGEFWNRQFEPDGPISLYGPNNYTVKQAASAAHIYGRPVCQAEAFTSLADDFTEDPWCMKDIGDSAFCDGLTRIVFHNWPTHLRPELRPGYWWVHIGVHFGYNLTWWPMANGWLTYLARCQHMLRQGLFVADFAYLQSEAIPSFTVKRSEQHPVRPPGFDYDPLNAEVLLTRASAKNGRLTLPDGMSYRYLVLPHQNGAIVSPDTLKKINELADAGVTVIGPKEFAGLVSKLREGALDAVVKADNLMPDIEFQNPSSGAKFDWIHRRDGGTEIYFLSNQSRSNASTRVVFRVSGRQPELWDAVTGEIRDLPDWRDENGRTVVPLQFAPRQSWFIVFRRPVTTGQQPKTGNFPKLVALQELTGAWEVRFDPKWGGPERITFDKLEDWTTQPEAGIRYYSGIATYRQNFSLPHTTAASRPTRLQLSALNHQTYLDLGAVKNVARVRLNGRDLGVVWTAPWRVEITGALKSGANELEIEVANLWPNRLIGDASLPPEKRITTSNISTYDVPPKMRMSGSAWAQSTCQLCQKRLRTGKSAELLPSGLLGPVTICTATPTQTENQK